MQPVEQVTFIQEQTKNKTKYIYFNFESTQDCLLQCEEGYRPHTDGKCTNCNKNWCGLYEHIPNMCVAQKVCDACHQRTISPDSDCEKCGKNEKVFMDSDTTQKFCNWFFFSLPKIMEQLYYATILKDTIFILF